MQDAKTVIETVQAMLDGCAADGYADSAESVGSMLRMLSAAAYKRSAAIDYRLTGEIEAALRMETQAEQYMRDAACQGVR